MADKTCIKTDIVIVGTGVSGLFCALNLPKDKRIILITKNDTESSDSYLAQGGICMMRDDKDYDSYFEDTMHAGHYENTKESVDIMIRSSREIIDDLVGYGVDFEKNKDGEFLYTREGAHSAPRILYHKDITGKEITSKLIDAVKKYDNITLLQNTAMLDIAESNGECIGIVISDKDGNIKTIKADYTVFATGGIGGLYDHSTNFSHLTGDGVAVCLKHNIKLKDVNYIQIHPTTLYSTTPGRRFLISESVRGEGAVLYNKNMERFVDELLPRDVVAKAIYEQMKKDDMPHVWLSLENIDTKTITEHFPNIYAHCLENGYDITKEPVPVVPAQHYFMGGIYVDSDSKTTMPRLYAVGETSCNGVHGANRLASNSLLESLVFAKRAAKNIADTYTESTDTTCITVSQTDTNKLTKEYKKLVLDEIERMNKENER